MRKRYVSVVLILIVLLTITSLSYTYYLKEKDYTIDVNTETYLVRTELTLNGVIQDTLSPYYDTDKHAYVINLYDEEAINYIGNLALDIYFEVPIASKLRYQLNQSYELTRYYNNQEQTVITEIIYQESIDNTYYPYSLLKKGSFTNVLFHSDYYTYALDTYYPEQTYHLNIISSGLSYAAKDNSLYYETCYLYLDYSFEFVQANRFSQVWNVDPLLLS